jgi:hypothetical protein
MRNLKKKISYAGKEKARKRAAKRAKPLWWVPDRGPTSTATPRGLDPDLAKEFAQLPTGFENLKLRDFAFWLTDPQQDDPALRAVEEADRTGNPQSIIDFLRSGQELTRWGGELIADYMDRNRKGKSGPKQTPVYARTLSETMLLLADEQLRYEIKESGTSLEDAAAVIAPLFQMSIEKLLLYHNQRLGSVRRLRTKRHTATKTGRT